MFFLQYSYNNQIVRRSSTFILQFLTILYIFLTYHFFRKFIFKLGYILSGILFLIKIHFRSTRKSHWRVPTNRKTILFIIISKFLSVHISICPSVHKSVRPLETESGKYKFLDCYSRFRSDFFCGEDSFHQGASIL